MTIDIRPQQEDDQEPPPGRSRPILPPKIGGPKEANVHRVVAKYTDRLLRTWKNRPPTFEQFPIDPVDEPYALAIRAALQSTYERKETGRIGTLRQSLAAAMEFLADADKPPSLEELAARAERHRERILKPQTTTVPDFSIPEGEGNPFRQEK